MMSLPLNVTIFPTGTIGGVGLRLYFFLLRFLIMCFFVMAVISTPSIIIMFTQFDMYEHAEATRYRTWLAMTTLGNVKVSENEQFCIKNVELCAKNEKFCIYNDELCSIRWRSCEGLRVPFRTACGQFR